MESTVNHFGKLDILVNAAAGNFLVAAEDMDALQIHFVKIENSFNLVLNFVWER